MVFCGYGRKNAGMIQEYIRNQLGENLASEQNNLSRSTKTRLRVARGSRQRKQPLLAAACSSDAMIKTLSTPRGSEQPTSKLVGLIIALAIIRTSPGSRSWACSSVDKLGA